MNRLSLITSQISSTSSSQKKVLTSINSESSIGFISLNSPKDLNSLSQQMIHEICEALYHLHSNDSVKVIIIQSTHPKIFCAGADIKRFIKHEYDPYYIKNEIFHQLEEGFAKTKKPTIAVVNGKALGGGFELALLCDIILTSNKGYFALPEVTLGLMPGIGGTQRLTKIIGEKLAMRYILSAEGFDGKRAAQLNIAEFVDQEGFDENVRKIAEKISSKALTTTIIAKNAVKFATNSNLSQGLEFEKSTFYPLLATRAAKEGINAFVSKRKANFKGM